MKYLLEGCVDSVESALYAQAGGADRLELCANLIVGGTSPSAAMIQEVLNRVQIPVNVLLRPRFGDFCFTEPEKRILLQEIRDCRELGVNAVVVGALLPDGQLDIAFLEQCREAAGTLNMTLHRAFDVARDPFETLEAAIHVGFQTVLTSGQKKNVDEGEEMLCRLQEAAAGRIEILVGCGVNSRNIEGLARRGLTNFHSAGKHTVAGPMQYRNEGVPMGLPMLSEYDRVYTDEAEIRAMRDVLDRLEKA